MVTDRQKVLADYADRAARQFVSDVRNVRGSAKEYQKTLMRMGVGLDLLRASERLVAAAEALFILVEDEGML